MTDAKGLTGSKRRVLMEELGNIYTNGPVWDGDVISKQSRDELVKLGMVTRLEGYNIITDHGRQVMERQ